MGLNERFQNLPDHKKGQVTKDFEKALEKAESDSGKTKEQHDFEKSISEMTDAEFEQWRRKKGVRRDGLD